jgi:hypothetical protein
MSFRCKFGCFVVYLLYGRKAAGEAAENARTNQRVHFDGRRERRHSRKIALAILASFGLDLSSPFFFMTRFFDGDNECTQVVLRTILGRDDLTVTKAVAQKVIKSLKSRSVRLDVYAVDCEQKPYDIEIQRADEGAGARRARYNSAMMDADETVTGMDTENLPESYVIFITENDIYGKSQPLYKIERYIDGAVPFNDGSHIIYVNGKYRGNDPIGDLMHDFSCKKSEDMKNSVLADKARRMKETEQGVTKMCRIMEEFAKEERAEAKEETQIETAEEMLKEGSLPLEKIAQFSKLPLETIKQLSEKLLVVQA